MKGEKGGVVNRLTVKLVEELQEANAGGIPIESVVSNLETATLPALLEYGCLRWATNAAVPRIPTTIWESALGKALFEVPSDIGLRSSGPQKSQLRQIDCQRVEFHKLDAQQGITDEAWKHFEIRFDRSAQSVGFSRKTAHRLQAALHEMAENALIHAETSVDILVGYAIEENTALFSVADVGIGVLASLRTHPAYQYIELHKDAIRAALYDGTTRFGPNSRGTGFRQIFKALAAQWGYLRFRSGNGCVTLNGTGLNADQGEETFPPPLPGFQVTVCCRTAAPPEPFNLV